VVERIERTCPCYCGCIVQADELEEAFTELVVEYKHEEDNSAATTAIAIDESSGSSVLLLPADRLMSWAPVQKMLRSGAATNRDVTAAIGKAKEASFHHQHNREGVEGSQGGGAGSGSMVDFVGFLEFIHTLDVEVGRF